jgi:integrase
VKEHWGGWAADKLTHEHLEATYLDMLGSGRKQWYRGKGTVVTEAPLSHRSVEAIHKSLKAAYALAIRRRQLTNNPADEIELSGSNDSPKSSEPRPHWTPEEVGKFLEYMARTDQRPTGLADVLADTGARIGEVLGLHWDEVDLEKAVATIVWQLAPDPEASSTLTLRKTKRPRSKSVISLHPETITALRARKAEQATQRLVLGAGWPSTGVDAGLVFTWPDGRGMNSKTVSKALARLSVAAGLPRLTAHGFRHSFATAALTARVPVEVVAARLGNTPRVVQETYQHVIAAEDEAAANLVGDLYRAKREA